MNTLTKDVVKRILELDIKGVNVKEDGTLCRGSVPIVGKFGDVNFSSWHGGTLKHEYFKFDTYEQEVYIQSQDQADEFVEIVANYFGIYGIKESVPKEILDQTMRKLTHREKLQRVYNDALSEIVEELGKEYGEGFKIVGNWLRFNDEGIASLVGTELRICDTRYFECIEDGDTQWIEIDEVKVRKAFDVAEELCEIEMPGNLHLAKNAYGRVVLKCGTISIDSIYYGPTRKIYSSKLFVKKQQEELYKKFGSILELEQGKEFVKWVAEVLGGTYEQ